MAIDINRLWEEKINLLSTSLRKILKNDDAYQDAVLGIRHILLKNPDFPDYYILKAAVTAAKDAKKRGVSVDNGRNRKVEVVHALDFDKEFEKEFSDESQSPEILTVDKVSAEQFYASLTTDEMELVLVCLETNKGFYTPEAQQKLKLGFKKFYRRKREVRRKFINIFEE